MANLISVPVYQIGSSNKLTGARYIGIGVNQIHDVSPVTGTPTPVNGNYVYSVITMAGTTQYPGASYYTSLTVAAIITAAG